MKTLNTYDSMFEEPSAVSDSYSLRTVSSTCSTLVQIPLASHEALDSSSSPVTHAKLVETPDLRDISSQIFHGIVGMIFTILTAWTAYFSARKDEDPEKSNAATFFCPFLLMIASTCDSAFVFGRIHWMWCSRPCCTYGQIAAGLLAKSNTTDAPREPGNSCQPRIPESMMSMFLVYVIPIAGIISTNVAMVVTWVYGNADGLIHHNQLVFSIAAFLTLMSFGIDIGLTLAVGIVWSGVNLTMCSLLLTIIFHTPIVVLWSIYVFRGRNDNQSWSTSHSLMYFAILVSAIIGAADVTLIVLDKTMREWASERIKNSVPQGAQPREDGSSSAQTKQLKSVDIDCNV